MCKQLLSSIILEVEVLPVNTRNFLCGKVVSRSCYERDSYMLRDSSGRIQSIDRDDMMGRLPEVWERSSEKRDDCWNGMKEMLRLFKIRLVMRLRQQLRPYILSL